MCTQVVLQHVSQLGQAAWQEGRDGQLKARMHAFLMAGHSRQKRKPPPPNVFRRDCTRPCDLNLVGPSIRQADTHQAGKGSFNCDSFLKLVSPPPLSMYQTATTTQRSLPGTLGR